MHVWEQHVSANHELKIVLCIEFEQLQRTMSNKVVTASDKYSICSPSIRYIIYGCVLMLFHVQVSLIALLTTFTGVFDQETIVDSIYKIDF